MNFPNPTPLRVGMVGTFSGKRYRVAGRVVMGMEENGQTYYWNEFNLENLEGESSTLAYEETESGGQWRMFILFEPQYPMTAEDAAAKGVGDTLDFGEGPYRVTLVDESRVYQIEGVPPEGVELGDVARYFNAETGAKMIVVSWTGDEVEYYTGADLSPETVMSAFNLRPPPPEGAASFLSSGETTATAAPAVVKLVVVFLVVVILFASYSSSCHLTIRRAGVTRSGAPDSPLRTGMAGNLDGRNFRIQEHALVEIAQVGRRYDRHEYGLADENGNPALLVLGWKPGAKDWLLFTPVQPPEPLTPAQAAAVRWGQTVNLDGIAATVDDLAQSTVRQVDGAGPLSNQVGQVSYSFSGRAGDVRLLVRWSDGRISFYRGKALPPATVITAFGPPSKN
jgi:hypothetical protein